MERKESSYYRLKRKLYEERGGKCESPYPCSVTSINLLTIDHFTPRCIGELLGWTPAQINDPMNLELLCPECHQLKDATTKAKKSQVLRQLKGGTILFGWHK